jgi:hypothetical protein
MKHAAVFLLLLWTATCVFAQTGETKRKVLIEEKLLSKNEYRITARGYPKPDLTDPVQINGSAREAALLNAQILARERFRESLDVIRSGTAKSYRKGDGYCDVQYIITFPNIKNYLRERKP